MCLPDAAASALHPFAEDGLHVLRQPGTARAGELFAASSLFAERYHCDAEGDSEVWHYPKEALIAHLQGDPTSLWQFAVAPDRLLQYLRLACDANCCYRPQGAWKELAAELGLTHEAL